MTQSVEIIKLLEGCRLEAYKDQVGKWTIGYGHTRTARAGLSISQAQAEALLSQDLSEFEEVVWSYDLCLTTYQFDALVSFAYNVGAHQFDISNLLKEVKKDPENHQMIMFEWFRWTMAGGKRSVGHLLRRIIETNLYCNGKIIKHNEAKERLKRIRKVELKF